MAFQGVYFKRTPYISPSVVPLSFQRDIGQPVLIGGSMGTCSYVLVGTQTAMEQTFGSTCHGAGVLGIGDC